MFVVTSWHPFPFIGDAAHVCVQIEGMAVGKMVGVRMEIEVLAYKPTASLPFPTHFIPIPSLFFLFMLRNGQ